MKSVLVALALFFGSELQLFSQSAHPLISSGKLDHLSHAVSDQSRAAACAPATSLRDLEWNNINALIETGGSLWQDRANGRSHYFAPKNGDVGVMFAGSLWLGGVSPDQQLKLAALLYRYSGNDYWPGPLTNDGAAEVTATTCQAWDKFAVSLRTDAALHRQYHDCMQDPNCDMDRLFPNGYSTPSYFQDYPAHGNVGLGQDFYIAPFYDYDGNGVYEPENGDYPWYDLSREINCKTRRREDIVPLFGDQTFYWVFNDKGNIHSETGGQPIGMEIRGQAFAFSTNDEVNNMTFYNYVLINQGSQTLQETYFGTWIDLDIGGHVDDYVGCDVQRGLGYGYNGDAFDGPTGLSLGYGENPPAVGVDFFEGPYQDEDNTDNPLTSDIATAIEQKGIPYKGIGIGYGDGVVDNERFGMRKFLYHNSGQSINGPPEQAVHYYNYLRGFWKNGQRMAYGGNALTPSSGADLSIAADYMFPGDTDPNHFGTSGVITEPWTEVSSGNPPADRRFMQSAGPFTLEPGDYNNITVGVVYARATTGDPVASVDAVRVADDKAQALFDNCFELVSGPDAPDVVVRELENEIILQWTNENPLSNNYNENYSLIDPTIPEVAPDGTPYTEQERSYSFQGYLIYQLANEGVAASDLEDISQARLIAQCDVQDDVSNIINYERDATTGQIVASLKVQGANQGVFHSLRVIQDAFALGAPQLINHKTYYFMILAYGYNNYSDFSFVTLGGQDEAFLPSRKAALLEIPLIRAIPHRTAPENGGTIINAGYGDGVPLVRLEGTGNGKNLLNLSSTTENEILSAPYYAEEAEYLPGGGPVQVKVVDPLRVPAGEFELSLADTLGEFNTDSMYWKLENLTTGDIDSSFNAFSTINEDLLLDYGLSITWGQYEYFNEDGVVIAHKTDLLESSIEFADPLNPWFTGIPDVDGFDDLNWIRSGTVESTDNTPEEEAIYDDYRDGSGAEPFTDATETFEKVLDGTWSPFCLGSFSTTLTDGTWMNIAAPTSEATSGDLSPAIEFANISNIKGLNNIDVVFTSDKSKWSRCPVLEMQSITDIANDQFNGANGDPEKMFCRKHKSVDKNGRTSGDAGYNAAEGELISTWGMGWFPGYVIDVGTGERLNVAFGEDSWLAGENGNDMIFNPSNRLFGSNAQALFGGQHWIYVFKNIRAETFTDFDSTEEGNGADLDYCPGYDQGEFLFSKLGNQNLSAGDLKKVYRACTWIGSSLSTATNLGELNSGGNAMLTPEEGLIPNTCRVRLRVAKAYGLGNPSGGALDAAGAKNGWRNLYRFSTEGVATVTNDAATLESELDNINIVPNPYYAFSSYETNKLDNRVKITNLPAVCTVSIYDLNGTRVRQFKKGDPTTSLDWDLKNDQNIPIASGTYIIHIEVPGIGEKILKWFGVMRPIDLDSF